MFKDIQLKQALDFYNGRVRPNNVGIFPLYGGNGIIDYVDDYNYEDNIIIGRVGANCGSIQKCSGKNWVSDNAISVTVKEGFDKDYIYYLLKLINLNSKRVGAAQPLLTQEIIGNINARVPVYSEQVKISKILSTLDRKISLNRSINAELERMAKEIYDYWFVQFEFPDEHGRPYKSSGGAMVYNPVLKREVPQGWEVVALESVLNKISSGRRPGPIDKSLKKGIPSLGAECVGDLGVFNYEKTPFVASEFQSMMTSGRIEDKDILIYKDGAYVGKTTLFQDSFPYEEAYVNEHVFLVNTKDEYLQYYLYFTLHQTTYFDVMQSLGKAKAAQPGLNQQDLKSIMIILPDKEAYTKFYKKVENYLHLIFCNALQSEELRQQRDELLPLLMTGQVEVI